LIFTDEEPSTLASITKLKSRLPDLIEPDFGLLDELLRLEVLSRREYDDVRSDRRAAYRRSNAVLDLLTTEDKCNNFVRALQRTSQQHVVNFIVEKGGLRVYSYSS